MRLLFDQPRTFNGAKWLDWISLFGLLATLVIAAGVWIQMTTLTLPHFDNGDQWVMSGDVHSMSFVEFIRRGHNGVPTYFHNALMWLDYHWAGHRVLFLRTFVLTAFPLGILAFFGLLRRAGSSFWISAIVTSSITLLWVSYVNHHNLTAPLRAMEATGVWLLFMLSLHCFFIFRTYLDSGDSARIWSWLTVSLGCAWVALYFHGGFAVLPILCFLVATSAWDSRRILMMIGVVLSIFIWHFQSVHTMGTYETGQIGSVEQVLFRLLMAPSAMVHKFMEDYSDGLASLVLSIGVSIAGLIVGIHLGLRMLRKRAAGIEVIAFALLAYIGLIALGVTKMSFLRGQGWEAVVERRYLGYSIYTLGALSLLALCWVDSRPRFRPLQAFIAVIFCIFICIAAVDTAKHIRRYRQMEVMSATATIPYTLEPWSLPDTSIFHSDLRREIATRIHNTLKDQEKFIFNTSAYKTYKSLAGRQISADLKPCEGRFTGVIVRVFEGTGGDVAEVFFTWNGAHRDHSGVFLLAPGDGKITGWGVGPSYPRQNQGINVWIDWVRWSPWRIRTRGFMNITQDNPELQIVPVDQFGELMCTSTNG